MTKKTGIELIAQERQEQIEKHGRTVESDLTENAKFELLDAAVALITSGKKAPSNWNQEQFRRMNAKPYKERLTIAGALLAAEIDRLLLLEEKHQQMMQQA